MLPERAEFGGLITNLSAEMKRAGVRMRLNTFVEGETIAEMAPEGVIVATGAAPVETAVEGDGHVVLAEDVLIGSVRPGARVLIADWRCDVFGIGMAIRLTREGHDVRWW